MKIPQAGTCAAQLARPLVKVPGDGVYFAGTSFAERFGVVRVQIKEENII
jgi:hypothetical protein